jgi:hypothetical protein
MRVVSRHWHAPRHLFLQARDAEILETLPLNQPGHDHNNDLGLITIDLPSGEHRVQAKLRDTPVRLLGDVLTLVFLPLALIVLVKKEKRHV